MKTIQKMMALMVLLSTYYTILGQRIPPESDFFTGTVNDSIISVRGAVNAANINRAIIAASRISGGAIVTIPGGTHRINSPLILKSNVHIRINPNATFEATRPMRAVFSLGRENPAVKISNVRIYSSTAGEKYTINYAPDTSDPSDARVFNSETIRAFHLGYVENFEISDFLVEDDLSFQAAVHLVPNTAEGNSTTSFNQRPNRGVIKNGNTTGADFGYGLVQIGAATNILLKNIEGTGGVTLRIEGSFDELAQAGRDNGRTFNIFAENVSCRNGNAAMTTQPHTKVMGAVVVRGLTSVNCATGIRLARGFTRFGIGAGYCDPAPHIGGDIIISSTGGLSESNESAQIRPPFHLYYPVNFLANNPIGSFPLLGGADEVARKGPAIVPIAHFSRRNAASVGPNNQGFYDLRFTPSNGRGEITGFGCTPRIVNAADIRNVCGSSSKILSNNNAVSQLLTITSNNKSVTIATDSETSVSIYNLNGNLVKESTVTSGVSTIEVPTLSPGIYIVKAVSETASKTQKVIMN